MVTALTRRAAGLRSALRWRRHTVRLRLALVYGGLFILSGAGLLAVTYVLVADRLPADGIVTYGNGGAAGDAGSVTAGVCFPPTGAIPSPAQISRCIGYLHEQAVRQRAAELSQLLTDSGLALVLMAVAAVALGWLVAGRVLRPLRTITAAARRVSASSLHERLAMTGPDSELKELGDTFDGLLARLEQAFGAQRQFVANASHELRTPLARQRTLVEVALADPEPTVASLRTVCERVLAAGQQQERLIEALLTLARSQRGLDRRERIDLAAVAADAVDLRRPEGAARGLGISVSAGHAPVSGDSSLLERLAANLLDNAVRHNLPGGWVSVATGMRGARAVITVANSGPVIPAAGVSGLFQPFERLGADRTGQQATPGLGLSIVAAIAAAHNAGAYARSLPGGGLEVEVRFPPVPGRVHCGTAGEQHSDPAGAGTSGRRRLAEAI